MLSAQVDNHIRNTAKCDFCDLHLKCDLDVSRHLSSESHRETLAQFLSLQNLNTKSVQKEVPKNLIQVFQALKLRSDRDARELADKGYFKIYDDSICGIAIQLVKTLIKSLVEFETRGCAPSVRAAFMDAVEHPEESAEPKDKPRSPVSNVTESTPKRPISPTETSCALPKKIQKIQHPTRPQSQGADQPQKARSSETSTLQQPKATNQPDHVRRAASESGAHPQDQLAPRTQSQPRLQSKHHKQPQAPQQPQRRPLSRPHEKSRPQQSQIHSQDRPKSQTQPLPLAPTHPPQQSPASTPSDGNPKPRPDSTYVPRLAKIKTEPKDN